MSESLVRIAGYLEILRYDTSADAVLKTSIYLTNASLDRRESSIFALNPRDESNSISMDGNGIPNNGQVKRRALVVNSVMMSNAHMAWRALLLAFTLLPIALSLAYKAFIGGSSTHDFGNHTSWYGLTAAPGLTNNAILKFGPSYRTNATLPFIMASPDPTIRPQFPQTYGFNHLVVSNTSSAFLDVPLPEQVLPLQQALQKDTTSDFTLTADVHVTVTTYNDSIEKSRDNDAFWDFYLHQRGQNSTPNSFSSVIDKADLCSGKTLSMLTGHDETDASWIILSFVNSNVSSKSSDI